MSGLYENPRAPDGYEYEGEPYLQLYKPLDPRMKQFMVNEKFESLVHLLDETQLLTDSEEEIEVKKEEMQEIPQNPITLDETETLASLNAFIAKYKYNSKVSEKEAKDRRKSRKKKRRRKRSRKLSRSDSRYKNKSSCNTSAQQDSLVSHISTSQSSSSSAEGSSKQHHNSTTLDESSIHITPLNHRSSSPLQCTSHYKSSTNKTSSKCSTSPSHRFPSHEQYSSSRRSSIRTPSRSPSPTRSSSPRWRTSSSHRSHSRKQYSSSRKSHIRTPSRSPSPTKSSSPRWRTSPSRKSHSRKQYSSSRKSHIRTPSRSPSFEKLHSHYKVSTYERSSKRHSSHSSQFLSSQRSPSPSGSQVRSPEKSSNRYKSYEKSSKVRLSPSHRSSVRQQSLSPRRPPSHRSSMHLQSLSPCRSPNRNGSPVRSDRSSNQTKSSVDERSKRGKSPHNKSPIPQRKFPIEDEYTRILAEEMKKRQIWEGSDLEEEGEVIEQKLISDTETKSPVKTESTNNTKDLPKSEQNLVDKELKIANKDELQSNSKFPQSKLLKQEMKSESLDQKGFSINSFYCSICQLGLNSEVTWQSHITGKRHAKVLKLQTVHEVAKGSIAVPSTSTFSSEDTPRFGYPSAGKIRRPITDVPRIQPAIDSFKNCSILGLKSVCEIRSEREVTYYCELCDAPCSAHSIMPHLIGYKHQLRFLREIDPDCYERNKLRSKKEFEYRLSKILSEHERKFGRGRMKVFEERDDTGANFLSFEADSQPVPSWKNSPSVKQETNTEDNSGIPPNDECLDTSKADFYCKLCDAHMNNMNMWESHVRGKRHLRNAKKIPGENISKVRSVKAPPHVASKLDKILHEKAADEIIVGLDSIRETQGPNGENYTCFPCGSNCTNFDIIDHLLLTRHRIRYLEKLVADGKPNAITTISQVEMHDDYFRKHLIDDECLKMMEKYGSGTVEVYLTKK